VDHWLELHAVEGDVAAFGLRLDALRVAQQDRRADAFVEQDLRGALNVRARAIGKHQAPARPGRAGALDQGLHDAARAFHQQVEPLAVAVQIQDGLARHAGFGGGFRHGGRDVGEHARVERFGDDVVVAEGQIGEAVSRQHFVGNIIARELREGMRGRDQHLLRNAGGAAVESSAKHERETEHVVDLIGVVRATRGQDGVRARAPGDLVRDLGVGIGHGKDDGARCHASDHRAVHHAADAQPDERVGAL
jgi:hypothetical protein